MATLLRGRTSPLLSIGDLSFDCEISGRRGGRREYTNERIAAGIEVSDHSFRRAREFTLSGAVSAIAQFQNLGRPGSISLSDTLTQAGEGVSSLLSLTDGGLGARITDFETRLDGLIETGGELEVVSKVIGRPTVVLLEWDATNTAEDGNKAVYNLTLKEVLRAGLTIADATPGALALTGTGGAVAPGSGGGSMATPGVLAVVP
jgi:hypothetical protein